MCVIGEQVKHVRHLQGKDSKYIICIVHVSFMFFDQARSQFSGIVIYDIMEVNFAIIKI